MKLQNVWLIVVLTAGLAFFASCQSETKTEIKKAVAEQPAFEGRFNYASGIKFDSSSIQKFLNDKPLFKEFRKDFLSFYGGNNYNYVWYDQNGLIETSGILLSGAENIAAEGVNANVPYKDTLGELLHAPGESSESKPDLNTELMLTGTYFYYAKKIWTY